MDVYQIRMGAQKVKKTSMSVARLVQKRMPMRSSASFRIVNRVRASRRT